MKILFNKNTVEAQGLTGAGELSEITGSYYANNDFSKIRMDVILETEKVIRLIGPEIYEVAEDFYYEKQTTVVDRSELLEHIRLPIAIAAATKFYQGNIISHEDTGRKLKLDKNKESIGWEWMYDRDDEAHERKANDALDRLINYLDASGLTQWKNSAVQKSTRSLFINNTTTFQNTYPIDDSGRFYYKVVPFIAEIERTKIKLALGSVKYKELLAWHQDLNKTDSVPEEDDASLNDLDNSLLLALIRECVPLLTMVVAVQRFAISVLPDGVVQQFMSMMQGRKASQPALDETRRLFLISLQAQANQKFDELKKYIKSADVNASNWDLLPKNECGQKYFRT
jgi:hypothetical protein